MPLAEQFVAISCATVGIGPGGTTSMLAWLAVIDYRGKVVLEHFVAPTSPVSDYRTSTTGLTESHLHSSKTISFETARQRVSEAIRDKVVIGHALWNDLSVVGLPHLASATRDVALYRPFRNTLRAGQVVGLKTLLWQFMSRTFGEECAHPAEKARASLDLYRTVARDWEEAIVAGHWPCEIPPPSFARCYM